MIKYSNESFFGYAQYFHVFGSAIFSIRCLPQAILGGILAFYSTLDAHWWQERVALHPTAYFSSISVVLGFLLVFRSQLAYNRYWEGRTQLQHLISKLDDIAIHTMTFIQRNDDEAKEFQSTIGWMLISYLGLVVSDLRGEVDDFENTISTYNIQLSDDLKKALDTNNFKTYFMMSSIVDLWVKWSVKGGFAVAPPIQSRSYAIMSEAQMSFNGAQKIQSTPFPYPLMQVCGMLLHVYLFSAPFVIGAYLEHTLFGTVLSFFSVLGFFALNKTAEELEDPFGTDPNDLPLDTYLNKFRRSMFSIGLVKDSNQWSKLRQAAPEKKARESNEFSAASLDQKAVAEQENSWKCFKIDEKETAKLEAWRMANPDEEPDDLKTLDFYQEL